MNSAEGFALQCYSLSTMNRVKLLLVPKNFLDLILNTPLPVVRPSRWLCSEPYILSSG